MSVRATAFLVLLFDLAITFVAWLVAFGLRFNFKVPDENLGAMWNALPVMLVVHVLWFVGAKTYRPLWRFTSVPDIKRLAVAVIAAGVTTPVILLMVGRLHLVPRSLLLLSPVVLFLMLAGARFVWRAWFDGHFVMARTLGRPVVILGAGSTAARLIASLYGSPTWQVVALLDDDKTLHGSSLGGVNIFGGIGLLPDIVVRFRPLSAFIAMPSASAQQRARATQLATSLGLNVLSVADGGSPAIHGNLRLEQVDPVELLTTRSSSINDQILSELVLRKVVLITGIDSPLGQEFCRQVVNLGPTTLLCLDRSAKVLWELQRQLGTDSARLILGDYRDEKDLRKIFEQYQPDVVCHLGSARFFCGVAFGNEWESLRESVLPVVRSMRQAVAHGSGVFILITAEGDTAECAVVNAGLRLGEAVCLAARTSATNCVCVRLGPEFVLAHDDLISGMKREIDAGGPVSVSDPQSECSILCESDVARVALLAAVHSMRSKDRAENLVYLPRVGTSVRVADFVRNLIKLSGFSEDQIAIAFTAEQRGIVEQALDTRPTEHPELVLSSTDSSRVGGDALEEVAAWLDGPARNPEQISGDLKAWGVTSR